MIEPRQPTIDTDGGPWATHDMACAVCRKEHAVLDLGTGIFRPCWTCQEKGWRLAKPGWFARWLLDRKADNPYRCYS